HKDDLFDVDDCLELTAVDGWHLHLIEDRDAGVPSITNGYFPLPLKTIKAWEARQASASETD
ncbi:MAG: hypothetical protein V2J10_12440, partial [Wenzhouxiangella sp.]|nr:hypothetical protein [Wenzhouxiangella sp.]